ncbi:MAG: hypothetical protein HZB13_01120 [Acidobacteria bacterium]|nr:hypothetical protein [Acidobacteriota bacterium]
MTAFRRVMAKQKGIGDDGGIRDWDGSGDGPDRLPEVVVVHTTPRGTQRALAAAAELARGLSARVRLVAAQVVPYPRMLTDPPTSMEFTKVKFKSLAAETAVEVKVDVRYCRDVEEMLLYALNPGSLVVVGCERKWWPTTERRLAWRLRRNGHHVVTAERQ